MDIDNDNDQNSVYITFDRLPEAAQWKVGQAYRVKVVLRQTGADENGATFDIVDANSLEPTDKAARRYITDGGYLKG